MGYTKKSLLKSKIGRGEDASEKERTLVKKTPQKTKEQIAELERTKATMEAHQAARGDRRTANWQGMTKRRRNVQKGL